MKKKELKQIKIDLKKSQDTLIDDIEREKNIILEAQRQMKKDLKKKKMN